MAPAQSSMFKLTPAAALLAALIVSAGCAMPPEPRVAYAAPALVEMSPGIWAVQDYPGYYYANGDYWYYADDGVWYERPYWGGPWAGVDIRMVPHGVVGRAGFPGRGALDEPGGFARGDRPLHAEMSVPREGIHDGAWRESASHEIASHESGSHESVSEHHR